MDQTVNIPFCHKLEPGDNEFTIEVLSRFRDNPNRLFGFSTVTLSPDYFSKKAYALDMDSEKELSAIVSNDFHFEVEFDKNVFDATAWSNTTATTLGPILQSINNHFEQNKPEGCIFPAVVFDWFDLLSLGGGVDSDDFHRKKALTYYGVEYKEADHSNWLPTVYRDKTRLNNMMFPTKAEAMADIRIRMTLSPNVMITFSNKDLPDALGISASQLPEKVNKQYQFKNTLVNSLTPMRFLDPPKLEKLSISTKIHAYPTKAFVVSNVSAFKTTVGRERMADLMAKDYNNNLKSLAYTMNLDVHLEYLTEEKKFKLFFPASVGIRVHLRTPTYIGHKLGYGHVDKINKTMQNTSTIKDDFSGEPVLTKAQVLVYDAGMVVVSLDERGSQQTHQFSNTYMAILEAHESGVLTTKPGIEMPRVPVSQFNKDLKFALSRFNENNEPIPLGWKDGAYIRGVLIGKV